MSTMFVLSVFRAIVMHTNGRHTDVHFSTAFLIANWVKIPGSIGTGKQLTDILVESVAQDAIEHFLDVLVPVCRLNLINMVQTVERIDLKFEKHYKLKSHLK